MDIDGRGLSPEELAYLDQKVTEFRKQEGLLDDEQVLHHGYLLRGKAYTFLKSVHETLAERRRLAQEARYTSASGYGRGRIT